MTEGDEPVIENAIDIEARTKSTCQTPEVTHTRPSTTFDVGKSK